MTYPGERRSGRQQVRYSSEDPRERDIDVEKRLSALETKVEDLPSGERVASLETEIANFKQSRAKLVAIFVPIAIVASGIINAVVVWLSQ